MIKQNIVNIYYINYISWYWRQKVHMEIWHNLQSLTDINGDCEKHSNVDQLI